MPVLIKICGLTTPTALDAALDAGADLVGFVFFPPSPRHIGFEAMRVLGERVQNRARKVVERKLRIGSLLGETPAPRRR